MPLTVKSHHSNTVYPRPPQEKNKDKKPHRLINLIGQLVCSEIHCQVCATVMLRTGCSQPMHERSWGYLFRPIHESLETPLEDDFGWRFPVTLMNLP